jgi:hypothetical protein
LVSPSCGGSLIYCTQWTHRTGIVTTDNLVNKIILSRAMFFFVFQCIRSSHCAVTLQNGLMTTLWAILKWVSANLSFIVLTHVLYLGTASFCFSASYVCTGLYQLASDESFFLLVIRTQACEFQRFLVNLPLLMT